jgi:hypothetical protein
MGVTGQEAGEYCRRQAMESLKTMDKRAYVEQMQAECRRIMGKIADAVNAAPTGNVISGSEMEVRDLMEELRKKAFQRSVQMRIDAHEAAFSPSQGRGGQAAGEQGSQLPQHAERQRAD